MVRTNSLFPILVILAVRNCVSMPKDFNLRTFCKRSTVFLAKREISFTTTISNRPFSASAIIRRNSLRFLIFVPEIPSSAYNFTKVSPVRFVYSEKNCFWASRLLSWSALSVETRQYAAIFIVLPLCIKFIFCYIYIIYQNKDS